MGTLTRGTLKLVVGSGECDDQDINVVPSLLVEVDLKKELPRLFGSNKSDVLHLLRSFSVRKKPELSVASSGPTSFWKLSYQGFVGYLYYEGEVMRRINFLDNFSRGMMTPEETNEFLIDLGFAPLQMQVCSEDEDKTYSSWNWKSYHTSFEGIAVNVVTTYKEKYGMQISILRTATEVK